ncbi:thiamine phosphate synthase [Salisaeta longa]|uniref:thiamine phosphate synthase n=1 Tax=Salisaeta longa TaxID=503170 RepID=UPI0003B516CC|nr:thiamine phosphate synthase [Salisaeta longa]
MTARGNDAVPDRLVLIADGFVDPARAAIVRDVLAAGVVRWVHLRAHDASVAAFAEAAKALQPAAREAGAHVSVNSRLAVAAALGSGFHTGAHGPPVAAARRRLGPAAQIGCSAHAVADLTASQRAADYFFFSPVFPTSSKPGHPGAGVGALAQFCAAAPQPVMALGGITPTRVAACCTAGAAGVAVLSGIMDAADPVAAARAYQQALAAAAQ